MDPDPGPRCSNSQVVAINSLTKKVTPVPVLTSTIQRLGFLYKEARNKRKTPDLKINKFARQLKRMDPAK